MECCTWFRRPGLRINRSRKTCSCSFAHAFAAVIEIFYETGLYLSADDSNYRIPDLVIAANAHVAERGVEQRAELVVEVLSRNDMSRDKLPFYAACNVKEVWLVDPKSRDHEIYVLRGRQYFAATPDRDGTTHAPLFALDFRTIDGPKLRITAADESVEI